MSSDLLVTPTQSDIVTSFGVLVVIIEEIDGLLGETRAHRQSSGERTSDLRVLETQEMFRSSHLGTRVKQFKTTSSGKEEKHVDG